MKLNETTMMVCHSDLQYPPNHGGPNHPKAQKDISPELVFDLWNTCRYSYKELAIMLGVSIDVIQDRINKNFPGKDRYRTSRMTAVEYIEWKANLDRIMNEYELLLQAAAHTETQLKPVPKERKQEEYFKPERNSNRHTKEQEARYHSRIYNERFQYGAF